MKQGYFTVVTALTVSRRSGHLYGFTAQTIDHRDCCKPRVLQEGNRVINVRVQRKKKKAMTVMIPEM